MMPHPTTGVRDAAGMRSLSIAMAAAGAASMAVVVPLTPHNPFVRLVLLALGIVAGIALKRNMGSFLPMAGFLLGAVPVALVIPITDNTVAGWTIRLVTAIAGLLVAAAFTTRSPTTSREVPA